MFRKFLFNEGEGLGGGVAPVAPAAPPLPFKVEGVDPTSVLVELPPDSDGVVKKVTLAQALQRGYTYEGKAKGFDEKARELEATRQKLKELEGSATKLGRQQELTGKGENLTTQEFRELAELMGVPAAELDDLAYQYDQRKRGSNGAAGQGAAGQGNQPAAPTSGLSREEWSQLNELKGFMTSLKEAGITPQDLRGAVDFKKTQVGNEARKIAFEVLTENDTLRRIINGKDQRIGNDLWSKIEGRVKAGEPLNRATIQKVGKDFLDQLDLVREALAPPAALSGPGELGSAPGYSYGSMLLHPPKKPEFKDFTKSNGQPDGPAFLKANAEWAKYEDAMRQARE